MDLHSTHLHGRLTVRQPLLLPIHDHTPPPQDLGFGYPCWPRGSEHLSHEHAALRRLVERETIEEHDGAVQVGHRFGGDGTVVVVGEREFSLSKDTLVHQGFGMERKGDQGISIWWEQERKVYTLWLRDLGVQKMLHLQTYMCAAKKRTTDPFERPGNPIMRERAISPYRNSLCLVDDRTGDVVRVLQEKLPLEAPPSKESALPPLDVEVSAPETPDKHAGDSPGGKLAHKVDNIIRGIHPRHNDSEMEPEAVDWSGDTPTDLLILTQEIRALPFIVEATPTKRQNHGTRETSTMIPEPAMLHPRTESMATFTTLATYKTGREDSTYHTADEGQGFTRPSSFALTIAPTQHVRPLSEASVETARPLIRDSSDDVLLEFLGREGTIRMSHIRQPGTGGAVVYGKKDLQKVGADQAASIWTYLLSPLAMWQSIPSFSSWFSVSIFVQNAEDQLRVGDKRRINAAALTKLRLSVVYYDELGHERQVYMRK